MKRKPFTTTVAFTYFILIGLIQVFNIYVYNFHSNVYAT